MDKNLCDTCAFCVATCPAVEIVFGDGAGKDNVVECDAYTEPSGEIPREDQ